MARGLMDIDLLLWWVEEPERRMGQTWVILKLVRHLLLEAMHLLLIASCYY